MTTNNRQSVDEALLQTVRCIKAFVAESDGIKPETIALIKMGGGMVIDPKPRFLDGVENVYVIQSNGVALYRDKNHLTVQGAQFMLLPLFRESLIIE